MSKTIKTNSFEVGIPSDNVEGLISLKIHCRSGKF
jgi:hypothetical protein